MAKRRHQAETPAKAKAADDHAEYDRFEALAKRLLKVGKKDLDEARAAREHARSED